MPKILGQKPKPMKEIKQETRMKLCFLSGFKNIFLRNGCESIATGVNRFAKFCNNISNKSGLMKFITTVKHVKNNIVFGSG